MHKIDLALEVLRHPSGKSVEAIKSANKIVEDALNPPKVSENPEATKKHYAEETLKRLEKERMLEERFIYLQKEVHGAANANDRTRLWLREVEKLTSNTATGTIFAYVWLIVLTIILIVNI